MTDTVTLYRPVGLKELELIAQSHCTAFPPRLPEQPIFYPVLNRDYANQIARDWNARQSPFAGFVTLFAVERAYLEKFEAQVVGSATHQELWVPAEELAEFNRHLVGKIMVVAAYYGEGWTGDIDPVDNLPVGFLRG